VHDAHDYDAIWRGSGATLWRAIYAYSGGRRDVADDAVAEAFAQVMARGSEVREPLGGGGGDASRNDPPPEWPVVTAFDGSTIAYVIPGEYPPGTGLSS
jgi:hypothetical protein